MVDTSAAPASSAASDGLRRVKAGLKLCAYAGSAAAGVTRRALSTPVPEPALRVLMYHKVSAALGNSIAVTPQRFEEHVEWLRSEYAVVTPEDLLAVITHGDGLPRRAVLLTFDDGYLDNYEQAYPILRRAGLRALIFPATGYIGTTRTLPHDARVPVRNPMLSWEQLARMDDVFAVGSHGISHRVLTRLPSAEARHEIFESKRVIEEKLDRRVDFFSYPKGSPGDYSPGLEQAVRDAGYLCSFSTVPGANSAEHVAGGVLLRRYNAEPLPMWLFARLLEGDCDSIALKDSPYGRRVKSQLNRSLRTTTD